MSTFTKSDLNKVVEFDKLFLQSLVRAPPPVPWSDGGPESLRSSGCMQNPTQNLQPAQRPAEMSIASASQPLNSLHEDPRKPEIIYRWVTS
ncbi:hypothetical protein PoB_004718800 [Plakobranchus ocellatus]|uniref:Uncharacterized protein n=1 Tax=Plakobranchus ocellatus TaxID=259542 RepID=A0AAV4BPF9_9GAST|nr:hypothetical protein PoB_004718800 [Plakobranchus ocellatus]